MTPRDGRFPRIREPENESWKPESQALNGTHADNLVAASSLKLPASSPLSPYTPRTMPGEHEILYVRAALISATAADS